MGRRPKQTVLQRPDGQQAYEKMLIITNYQRNENQSYNEIGNSSQWSEWPSFKNLQITNPGESVEKRESFFL